MYGGEIPKNEYEWLYEKLDDDQRKLTGELKKKMEALEEFKSDAIKAYLSDLTYYRYLSGWKWNMEKAETALTKTVKWRYEYKPEEITIADIAEFAGDIPEPIAYHRGYDKTDHPVVYLHLANTDLIKEDDDGAKKFKFLVFIMETLFNHGMPKGRYKVTLVVDAVKIGLTWVGVIKRFGSVFAKLGDYYCEMLNKACCVNCGFTIRAIWTVAQAFMEKTTREKFAIEKNPKKLLEIVDADVVPKCFGGNDEWSYNIKEHLEFGKKE